MASSTIDDIEEKKNPAGTSKFALVGLEQLAEKKGGVRASVGERRGHQLLRQPHRPLQPQRGGGGRGGGERVGGGRGGGGQGGGGQGGGGRGGGGQGGGGRGGGGRGGDRRGGGGRGGGGGAVRRLPLNVDAVEKESALARVGLLGPYRWRRKDPGEGAPQSSMVHIKRDTRYGNTSNKNSQLPNHKIDIFNRKFGNQSQQRPHSYPHHNNSKWKINKFENQYEINFRTLEKLSSLDEKEIVSSLLNKKQSLLLILQSPIEDSNILVLILRVISKFILSVFDELKLSFLMEICGSSFNNQLRIYILDLPNSSKTMNNMYWTDQDTFWNNFFSFCEYMVDTSPSTALSKFKPLNSTADNCLEELKSIHGFTLSPETAKKFEEVKQKITKTETLDLQKLLPKDSAREFGMPPNDFRLLSVIPTLDDIIGNKPFLRPNIVNGRYEDIEHYLDVQFRLLREDCFGPLRKGFLQYVEDPSRKKLDNIRIHHNVEIVGPYVTKYQIGSLVQLDKVTEAKNKKIKWTNSKRFIYGSLLLLSNDNFNSLIVATVMDRNVNLLTNGLIPISVVNGYVTDDMYKCLYKMVECEVYFEPYYHVLNALKEPDFPKHFAMSKYIVGVDPNPQPPSYLSNLTEYKIENYEFNVLSDTWPSHEELELNESQHEAFKLALTHEFAVIQGPPGTGKTYLGLKVAETLIENLQEIDGCLMVVVCYTNHALDQFLEGLLKVTDSIVRIGGQSRNEAMQALSINTIRKEYRSHLCDQFRDLMVAMASMKEKLHQVEMLNTSVLSYKVINKFAPESLAITKYYQNITKEDPINYWLFENMLKDVDLKIYEENKTDSADDNIYVRNAGNYEDSNDKMMKYPSDMKVDDFKISFNLNYAISEIKKYIDEYKINKNYEVLKMIILVNSKIKLFKEMLDKNTRKDIHLKRNQNPSTISMLDRWNLYFKWLNLALNFKKMDLLKLQKKVENAYRIHEEAKMVSDMTMLQNMKTKIIGITTSGAAKFRKLLKALAPPIVIVEEAAEVLEAHIVTALTKHCKHLILIGDHQQLRPSASHMRLARHFNIEVSLFERMIINNIHSRRLKVQHRMRPEISALISPHIYTDLVNHESVLGFPDVRGLHKNLFFLSHELPEQVVNDSSTRSNTGEADLVLSLANYIMQQGYEPQDVTILAAYAGQMFYMRQNRTTYNFLNNVKITIVDNYQGEESKIILLSLVRNNQENNVGFLGIENRICVALSRAREGLFVFGNINQLKSKSDLWTKIATTLEESRSLGKSITLRCENHSNTTEVSQLGDFSQVAEGGCMVLCNYLRPCGHNCSLACHAYDREHEIITCSKPCTRTICELSHPCPLLCCDPCKNCLKSVTKLLPCGHEKTLPCFRNPADPAVKCLVPVDVVLPGCLHKAKKPCHLDIKLCPCPEPCVFRLKCGHSCLLTCHVNEDAHHEAYFCTKPCPKVNKGCTAILGDEKGEHQCLLRCGDDCSECNVKVSKKRTTCTHFVKVKCWENAESSECKKKCKRSLACGHFCKNLCFQPCGNCTQLVKKVIESCGHSEKIECGKEATHDLCKKKCERMLPCNHKCRLMCNEQCKCEEVVEIPLTSPCGHEVYLPCSLFSKGSPNEESLLAHCREPCSFELACGHICAGNCSECLRGRLHKPCSQACNKRPNICGHMCEEPCSQVCPPCVKQCEIRCPHSRCNNLCGSPCVPCQEKCLRRCTHSACSRRCGEPCSRPPCSQPCPLVLACGHACRGLCGEQCPDCCRVCHPDAFPTDLIGDHLEDDAIIIQLGDCPHKMEVEEMDNMMKREDNEISVICCPYCRKPVMNTPRYKDLVNNMIKNEINPIKERVYGTEKQILEKFNQIQEKIIKAETRYTTDDMDLVWYKALSKLKESFKNRSVCNMYLLNLESFSVYLNVLDLVGEKHIKYNKSKLSALSFEVSEQINIICNALMGSINKISQQQQNDISHEIKRLGYIIQMAEILDYHSYSLLKKDQDTVDKVDAAKKLVLHWGVVAGTDIQAAFKKLEYVKTAVVSIKERELVVKAIGLKQGHWYKCPNGHFYCIGECGGANQVSKCIECGASVGGARHQLLPGNSHAGEMDGSRFAVWSEEYNNMANFRM